MLASCYRTIKYTMSITEDCFSLQGGLTALIFATREENVEVVRLLVDGKADVNTFENVST